MSSAWLRTLVATSEIRVGPAGWSYADWEGVVYPRPKPAGFHPLPHLARSFDCIELNSSFYGHPVARNAARWKELVGDRPRFRFVAKLHQAFTHAGPLDDASFAREREAFLAGLAPLGDRLAALLVQFPVGFRAGPASRNRLERIRAGFQPIPLVLEVRHASWFAPTSVSWIERQGFSLAAIDLPPSPDHPPADSPTPGPLGYLRLHGRNAEAWFDAKAGRDRRYDYLYDLGEVSAIAERARRIATGKDETYVVTNNHFSGKAVANALEILHALTGEKPVAPSTLVARYPRLGDVTTVLGQGSLF